MPITITPAPPAGIFGWGISLHVSSDFIGALPTGSFWLTKVFVDSEENNLLLEQRSTAILTSSDILIGSRFDTSVALSSHFVLRDGDTAWVRSELHSPTATLDSSITSAPWSNTAGLHIDVGQQLAAQGTGGFTTTDRANLQTIINNTTTTQETASGTTTVSIGEMLGAKSVDAFTATEITSGPTGGFVAHSLNAFVWAILVKITGIGPRDIGLTPDEDWFLRDLAVVRVFHGDDLYMRVPVHTSSKIIDLRPDNLGRIITAVEIALWPNAVSAQVNFAEGVTGQVFLLVLP